MIEHDKQSARSLEQPVLVEPENFQAAAGRRRFLKGLGIGLPAVMTLRSGALLAATSSQCLVNRTPPGNFLPPTAPAFSTTTDNWLRSGTYPEYIDSNSVKAVEVDGKYYNPLTGVEITPPYSPQSATGQNYKALCYVDNNGAVVSCDPTTSPTGLGVNGTCANSFMIQP